MGAAFYPLLDPPIDDYDPSTEMSGKALSQASDLLEQWSKELGVPDIWAFYSESHAESFATIGEEMPEDMEEVEIEWSDPQDGIRSIDAWLQRLGTEKAKTIEFRDKDGNRESVDAERLKQDLLAFKDVLLEAQEHGSKFRLRIDI